MKPPLPYFGGKQTIAPAVVSHIAEIIVHYNDTLLPVHIVWIEQFYRSGYPPRGWSLPLFLHPERRGP